MVGKGELVKEVFPEAAALTAAKSVQNVGGSGSEAGSVP